MKNNLGIILFAMLILSTTQAYAQESINFIDNNDPNTLVQEEIYEENLPLSFKPLILNDGEEVFKQVSRKFDVIDPVSTTNSFPGGRGANKLVIYTKNYGEHTGTNEFGTEAIVEGNIVTSLSGADSSIPQDGVVISGHGVAKNWISQNINSGAKIYIDRLNGTITVYTTSESYTFEANSKINEAKSIMNYYRRYIPGYSSYQTEKSIQTAQNYLQLAQNSKRNPSLMLQYSKEAIDAANMAIKSALPYVSSELKGVWIRPTEKNETQIIATLDKLKDNGFDSVFLETYYHGKTIFPSDTMNKYGFIVQNEEFTGFNPLEIWIKEAHKRGIKVHIWFQSFYVGNKNPAYNPAHILSVHPEWGNKTKQFADVPGATKSASEHNGYFLDPANPSVQDFLRELITEIITVYKPDGINLDYIRYPNANPRNDMAAWGFSEYARNEFKSMYGSDPIDLNISDAQWYDWNEYRRNKISQFVKSVGQIGKENKTYISTVIFPDIASALSTKQQDWRSWSYYGYIDGFTPLFLTYDSKMLSSMMSDVLRVKAPETELYAGLFVTFMGGSAEDLIRQIFETRKMKANGVILFDYAHTTPVYTTTLMAGAFNNTSKKDVRIAQKKNWWPFRRKNKKIKASAKQ